VKRHWLDANRIIRMGAGAASTGRRRQHWSTLVKGGTKGVHMERAEVKLWASESELPHWVLRVGFKCLVPDAVRVAESGSHGGRSRLGVGLPWLLVVIVRSCAVRSFHGQRCIAQAFKLPQSYGRTARRARPIRPREGWFDGFNKVA
jgi:hypothetical protein